MGRLTKARIDRLKPSAKAFIEWDGGHLPGFGLKVLPSGRKVFVLDARLLGKSRRWTLGRYGVLTLDQGKQRAGQYLRDITAGKDPDAEKKAAQLAMSVSDLCDRYLAAAEKGLVMTRFKQPKKSSTVAIDRGLIERHIKPLIGNKRVDQLTRSTVQQMIDDIANGRTAVDVKTGPRGRAIVKGGPGIATRTVELFSGIWNWADKRDYVSGDNPARKTDRLKSPPVDRRLSDEELAELGQTLAQHVRFDHLRPAGLALKLIALTGMRHGEVAALRWSEIDLDRHTVELTDSKSGRSVRPLGQAARDVVHAVSKINDTWVFPASRGSGHANFKKAFAKTFSLAGVDATPKALRSTFASVAADLGYSSGTIGDLLGHAPRGVTERHYIRRIDDVLVAAADVVSVEIQRRMDE